MKYGQRSHYGAALLILLAVVVAAFTVTLTSVLSINSMRYSATKKTTEAMQTAKTALEGFALRQQVIGALPCPDTDLDGEENTSGINCSSLLGLLPYKTLDLPALNDGYGNLLWYAVEQNLSVNNTSLKNPSMQTTLNLSGRAAAALIISPNRIIGDQVRSAPYSAENFLEGINADGDMTSYARVVDELHNDQLLEIPLDDFWGLMQSAFLSQLADQLLQYRALCGEFPWASDFGSAPYNSIVNEFSGGVPYHFAQPSDWNSGCASGIVLPSTWLTHWGDQIFYSFCASGGPTCIQINGGANTSVDAVLISPGVVLTGQTRPSINLADYFEQDNASALSPYQFRFKRNFDTGFNDAVFTLTP